MSLAPGLPARFSEEGNGFEALCELLSIDSRRRKEQIANDPWVRQYLRSKHHVVPRDTKTAERPRTAERLRLRLTFLYSQPDARRRLWRQQLEPELRDGDTKTIPSFEKAAFQRYDRSLLSTKPDKARLLECSAFYKTDTKDSPDLAPALAALPVLRDDVGSWSSLSENRQRAVIAAVLAAATILDDNRFIRWAAERVPAIADEFRFLDLSLTDMSPGVQEDLQNAATDLSVAVRKLAEAPTPPKFDVVRQLAARIEELRPAVLALAARKLLDAHLASFVDFLRSHSEVAPWLGAEAEGITARWREWHEQQEARGVGDESVESTTVALERARVRISTCLKVIPDAEAASRDADAALKKHQARLANIPDPTLKDQELEIECLGDALSRKRTFLAARQAVLDAAFPAPAAAQEPVPETEAASPAVMPERHDSADRSAPDSGTRGNEDTDEKDPPRATGGPDDGSGTERKTVAGAQDESVDEPPPETLDRLATQAAAPVATVERHDSADRPARDSETRDSEDTDEKDPPRATGGPDDGSGTERKTVAGAQDESVDEPPPETLDRLATQAAAPVATVERHDSADRPAPGPETRDSEDTDEKDPRRASAGPDDGNATERKTVAGDQDGSVDEPPPETPDRQETVTATPVAMPERRDSAERSAPDLELQGCETQQEGVAATTLSPADVDIALWTAIRDRRLGLAYQIARFRHGVEADHTQPTEDVLATLALGDALHGPDEEFIQELGRRVRSVLSTLPFANDDADTNRALNLLLFSATLYPALFAPQQTGVIPLLRRVDLNGELTPVYRFGQAVAEHGEDLKGVHLDKVVLGAFLNQSVKRDRLDAHLAKINQWRSSAGAATFSFAGAGVVWRTLLGRSGLIGELTALISHPRRQAEGRVREIVDQIADRRSADELIQTTYRALRINEGRRIIGPVRDQMVRRLDSLVPLAREWLELVEAQSVDADWIARSIESLQHDLEQHGRTATAALGRCLQGEPPLHLAAALQHALTVIESLRTLVGDASQERLDAARPGTADEVLTDDLLYVPSFRLEGAGSADVAFSKSSLALLCDANRHAKTLLEAFEERLTSGDVYGAHVVGRRIAEVGDPAEEECRNQLAQARRKLLRELDGLNEKLEQASIIEQFSEDDRDTLVREIVAARVDLRSEDRDRAVEAIKAVTALKARVEEHFRSGLDRVRSRIKPLLNQDPRDRELVGEALRDGDLITLNEMLESLESEQPLQPMDSGRTTAISKFISTVGIINAHMDADAAPSPNDIVKAVTGRKDIVGLPFAVLSSAQAERSSTLLDRWYLMTRRQTSNANNLKEFLDRLGFQIKTTHPRNDTVISITTEPLRDRALCPVHSFGSSAGGRYEVVLNWDAPAPTRIIQAIGAVANRPAIVLHFGRLPDDDRRRLRSWSLRESREFLTIDETLVLYLASLPANTLRTLFDCTLPFTSVQPFFTAAGQIPPESFYGRENERRNVVDQYGTCFVYGGRQLGKTALLRSAEASFHAPGSRRLARYIDLKMHDIGIAAPASDLWQVLWDSFRELGLIPKNQQRPRGRDGVARRLMKYISDWLSKDHQSRILLLLDEVDAFLKADLDGDFHESTFLKGLMDQTQRRFKVVLCGLHNVLRNIERANHPLAHFGEPICVGPFLRNGDLAQARALIREPLAAAGYSFEKSNLLYHILVWTNYYPSLIQLYGEALLRHLRESPGRRFPYSVTFDDIQAVLNRDGFRDYIRQRFSLTLALDPRYEVVVYAMALDIHGKPDEFSTGLAANRILADAKDAWPEGFEIPEHEFNTLLQEMCGLGVLRRRAGTQLYVFRNPNVFLLLGNDDDILEKLTQDRTKPDVFEASAFHGHYLQDRPQSYRRSPLTYADETLLQRPGVAVVCGNDAVNLRSTGEFLETKVEDWRLRRLEPCIQDDAALRRQLRAFRSTRRGTFLFLVDVDDPWSWRWLTTAADTLDRSGAASMRVVFSADPDQLWRLVEELEDEHLGDSNGVFDWIKLQPWTSGFLARWCHDQNLQEAKVKLDDLLAITGGWPLLLEHYAKFDPMGWDAKQQQLERYIEDHKNELLRALGLESHDARVAVAALIDSIDSDSVDDPVEAHGLTLHLWQRRLFWARCLGLVADTAGTLFVNPLVRRLLGNASP